MHDHRGRQPRRVRRPRAWWSRRTTPTSSSTPNRPPPSTSRSNPCLAKLRGRLVQGRGPRAKGTGTPPLLRRRRDGRRLHGRLRERDRDLPSRLRAPAVGDEDRGGPAAPSPAAAAIATSRRCRRSIARHRIAPDGSPLRLPLRDAGDAASPLDAAMAFTCTPTRPTMPDPAARRHAHRAGGGRRHLAARRRAATSTWPAGTRSARPAGHVRRDRPAHRFPADGGAGGRRVTGRALRDGHARRRRRCPSAWDEPGRPVAVGRVQYLRMGD